MDSDEQILRCAGELRERLDEVLPGDDEFREQLDALLARARRGEPAVSEIMRLAGQHASTRDWMANRLPPELGERRLRSYRPLPGMHQPPETDRFCCPLGDYVWERFDVGENIPKCPNHSVSLVRCR